MIEPPVSLITNIEQVLRRMNLSDKIVSYSSLSGGCIHQAVKISTFDQDMMIKWSIDSPPRIFLLEESGLDLLRQSNTIRVPQVYQAADIGVDCPAYILMEWVAPPTTGGRSFNQEKLGRGLAELHRKGKSACTVAQYGLDENNYIGRIVQVNDWMDHWIDFFREKRLIPQISLANSAGRLPQKRKRGLYLLLDQLDQWLEGVERSPSLLHGDLWIGNVIADQDKNPVLLDPAVYYGDREIDLAFTELFGGFKDQFYAAYNEVMPLDPGFEKRKHLYNLYHLVNHLNHFGETYGSPIDLLLGRFLLKY